MQRRAFFRFASTGSAALAGAGWAWTGAAQQVTPRELRPGKTDPFVNSEDGTKLFVHDWGSGRPILFLSAWTLQSNVWGGHMATLIDRGFRCVALDRRGHGRSEAPSFGYDLDTLADDVAAVIEQKRLKDAVLVAHSMGSVEAVRYCVRHGMDRVAQLILAAPVTPSPVRARDNPDGIPIEAIHAQRDAVIASFPKWISENEAPFFTPETDSETRRWIKNMMLSVSVPAAVACSNTMVVSDTQGDLRKITKPTLIVQGDMDASAPLSLTGARAARLIQNCKLIVYPGAPHALILTHKDRFIADLLEFVQG
jgi:pimeloyl-ACP methyl ester carboxylesterase